MSMNYHFCLYSFLPHTILLGRVDNFNTRKLFLVLKYHLLCFSLRVSMGTILYLKSADFLNKNLIRNKAGSYAI